MLCTSFFGLALRTWTNHGNAQVLSKEFLAGTLRLIHELYLNPMNPWNYLYLARVEPEILNMNTVPIPSSSPRGQFTHTHVHPCPLATRYQANAQLKYIVSKTALR